MPYQVQFAGLVCFYRDGGSRIALLPDGRSQNHIAAIVVRKSDVKRQVGWTAGGDLKDLSVAYVFILPPCTISLPGVDGGTSLDTGDHDTRIPRLNALQPLFRIDPAQANAITRIPIRQGKLTGYRFPGTNDVGRSAIISQLDVFYDYDITIHVNFDRSIELRAGTEVAIVNTAGRPTPGDHFRIYEQLALGPAQLTAPMTLGLGIPASPSKHVLFTLPGDIGADVKCTNTGCCP